MSERSEAKKEYGKPKLVVYGDIRQLTASTGNMSAVGDIGGKGANVKTA